MLDLMVVIDDEREVPTMNTDHNTLVSLLNTGYHRIKWDKPKPKTWNFGTLDKQNFAATLTQELRNIDTSISDINEMNTTIIEAMKITLQATAEFNKKGSKPRKHPLRNCRVKSEPWSIRGIVVVRDYGY